MRENRYWLLDQVFRYITTLGLVLGSKVHNNGGKKQSEMRVEDLCTCHKPQAI